MKTVKRRSQKQEKSVAKKFNARPTLASGALWFSKGDVRNEKFLIECKTTEKDFYSLTSKVWEKIEDEAVKDHMRIPLMVIDLKDTIRTVVFNPKYLDDFGSHLTYGSNKSYRITSSMLGYNEYGDYISSRFFKICGKRENVLCLMLLKDFEEQYKEEIYE